MLASVWHSAVAPEGTSTLEIRFPGDSEPKHKVQNCGLSTTFSVLLYETAWLPNMPPYYQMDVL